MKLSHAQFVQEEKFVAARGGKECGRKKSVAACSPDMFHPRGISLLWHMTKKGQILPTIAECDSYLCEKKC